MRRTLELTGLIFISTLAAVAQPSIGGMVNAASYAQAPFDSNMSPIGNNNIAQGSYFVIFGTGLGPANIVIASSLPLGTMLPSTNGTTVTISSGNQNIQAYMYYSLAGQVSGILPSNVPIGPAKVTVTYNGQTSAPYSINVVKTQLGLFTRNSQGNGPASVLVFVSATSSPSMTLTASAHPGDTIELFGTGLGAISGPDNVAPGVVSVGSNVTVNIAGTVVPAAYAGRQPQFPGEDQINVTLPANVATGCYVPAEITASGRPSNLFYISIAPVGSNTCVHPLGLSAAALTKLDAGGTVNTGLFQMLRAVVLGVGAEGAGGIFDNADANGVFQLFNRILFAFGGYNYPVPVGSCAVLDSLDPATGFSVPDFTLIGGAELRAADFINLAGTNGNAAVIPRQIPDTGGYLTVFFNTLGKGTWTLSTSSAGKDIGAFSAKTDVPDTLVWTNSGNFSSPPRNDLTITWSGGALGSGQGIVTVAGSSVVINPNDPSLSRGAIFYCNAQASAGRATVPAAVVQKLASSNGLASGEVYFGQLGIYTGGGSTFTAPLTSGAAFDGAYLAYGEAHTLSVKFQ